MENAKKEKRSCLKTMLKSRENVGLLWVLPALILLCVFCLYPVISAFYHSFTAWDGGFTAPFVGLENYAELFGDRLFWRSLLNVIILTVVGMVIGNAASIFLAELMYNLKSRLSGVYRFLFVLPAMVPGIITMLLWQKLILSGSSTGVMNTILRAFGLPASEWFASKNTFVVFLSIFFYGFPWMGGTSFLIYLAGLNGIDPSIIEAAKLDGLGTFRRVFRIDLPMIKGQLKYFLVMGFIGGLQNYTMQYAITSGGPGEVIGSMQSGTMVPGYYIFQLICGSSREGAYGYACAMGMVMFVIILAITVVNNRLVKSKENED
ncbi:MAG: carbohydrate ABC transporter permease [Candidatus Gallimonas sp.]